MKLEDNQIKEILLNVGFAEEDDIKKAEEFAIKYNVSLVNYFFHEHLLNKSLLGQAIAEYYNITYADLSSNQPSSEEVLKISEELALNLRIVLYKEDENNIYVATDNPWQKETVPMLQKIFPNKGIVISYSLAEDIDSALIHYRKSLETRFEKIIKSQNKVAPEIIDEILLDAVEYRCSDIHFEPQEEEVLVRFRIDGALHEAGHIPKKYYENILNRIKVQSHLRIDEHHAAQDGSIRYDNNGKKMDLRVSIVPTLEGEKVVIRILSEYIRSFTMNDLGLTSYNQAIVEEASAKPFGMILVVGPTGSGKTTTLYALLKRLNNLDVNITTIEDPVEYRMRGINQIQVNTKTNLTFAQGLKSIVRQDPNVILVGEIRDKETAEIAVNAALTGHLLFSTFHANNAATAIPRLFDMGIEPFLLSSTIEIIVAQRLAREICKSCRESVIITEKQMSQIPDKFKEMFASPNNTIYQGKGCPDCGDTGYKGRTALFEIIKMTPEMKDLALKSPSAQEIWRLGKQQNAKFLFEDGLEKVKMGVMTLEELFRVAPPPKE